MNTKSKSLKSLQLHPLKKKSKGERKSSLLHSISRKSLNTTECGMPTTHNLSSNISTIKSQALPPKAKSTKSKPTKSPKRSTVKEDTLKMNLPKTKLLKKKKADKPQYDIRSVS